MGRKIYIHSTQEERDIYLPRLSLITLFLQYPNYINARFSSDYYGYISKFLDAYHTSEFLNFNKSLLLSSEEIDQARHTEYTSVEEHIRYKYLLDVDGWTSTWDRIVWILRSNSLLLKQNTTTVEWFSGDLEDNVHYKIVPAYITNSLIDTIAWARNNDPIVRKIADKGTKFAIEHFSREALYETAYTILTDYYKTIYDSNNKLIYTDAYNSLKNGCDALNQSYITLHSDYVTLHSNDTTLSNNYNILHANYTNLSNLFNSLNTNYTALNNDYNTLKISYTTISKNFNTLNSNYIALNDNYNSLNDSYTTANSDFNVLNNMYHLLEKSATFTKKILLPVVGAVSAIAGTSLGAVSIFLICKYIWYKKNTDTGNNEEASSLLLEAYSVSIKSDDDVTPIGIALGSKSIELISLDNSSTYFDFDGKGNVCRTSWVGSQDAILFYNYDDNANSNHYSKIVLTHWSELEAKSDFEALLEIFDSNKDQIFNSLDSTYKKFGIWQDKNSNGQVEESEFMTLEEAGIVNIDFRQMHNVVLDDTIVQTADVIWKDSNITTAYDLTFHYISYN